MSSKIDFMIVLSLLLVGTSLLTFNIQLVRPEDSLLLEMNLSKTVIVIGETIDITLTLSNVGDANITITYTPPLFDAYYCTHEGCFYWSDNKAFIQVILDLVLEPGENHTETLQWDLYKYVDGAYYQPEPGTYSLFGSLLGWPCCSETVTLVDPYWNPADINHDLKVDIYDVIQVCVAYNSTPSDSNWNPHCDIAEPHEIIDIQDIVLMCMNYGEEWSYP